MPPSRFGQAAQEATVATTAVQTQERDQLTTSLPTIERPSGLPRRSERDGAAQPPPETAGVVRVAPQAVPTSAPDAGPAATAADLAPAEQVRAPLPAAACPATPAGTKWN